MIACVDIPALPLQLLWRADPSLRTHPVVIIDEDRPQGQVLWACERARAMQVLPGQRYAHALGLCAGLRASVMLPEVMAAAVAEIHVALQQFSPNVEVGSDATAGSFWLDGAGLARVFVDHHEDRAGTKWGDLISADILNSGLECMVVVGFSRFATYAVAKACIGAARVKRTSQRISDHLVVFDSEQDETRVAREVPLARLDMPVKLRDALGRLGVTTLGQMVQLPGGGIMERFGKEAFTLYQLAAGQRWDPLATSKPVVTLQEVVLLDDEERNVERLMFLIKAAVDRLLRSLAERSHAVVALHIECKLKHSVTDVRLQTECVKPASATLDSAALARLIHLRLAGIAAPPAPVIEFRVWADTALATQEQLSLFAQKPRRNLQLANEALAKLRAEAGEDAVVRAVLRPGHLPEAMFSWERVIAVSVAVPTQILVQPLVRRVMSKPQMLPPQSTSVRNDGWLLSGLEHGAVVRIVGPYVISGGWWAKDVHREYHFAQTQRGDQLWVYYDRHRRRWFCQGDVE
jgi:protein ImuB